MMELVQLAVKDSSKLSLLEEIYILYDQLQYSENIQEMIDSLFDWIEVTYQVNNINFSLFNIDTDITTTILQKGDDFYLDDDFTFYFIINTHIDLNAIVSFHAKDMAQYNSLKEKEVFIDAAFFQISPIIQNGIMKKYHIESSSVDSVTNVYNRKYLLEHIQRIITLSNHNDEDISFLMIGIDRFKAVVDEFDYDIGDKVLVELAKVIHYEIKDYDIVARLTGDEFLVALVNYQDLDEVENVAKAIIQHFADVKILVDEENEQILRKTVCIGISSFPNDSEDIKQVLKNADAFLHEAKNIGRSQVAIYEKEKESSIDLF